MDEASYEFFNHLATDVRDPACTVEALEGIARRLSADSHPRVVRYWCSSLATYARWLTPSAAEAAHRAYLRVRYASHISSAYFLGLRTLGVDLREHLSTKIEEDWSFDSPGHETWHYYLYLASIDAPGAYEALDEKIASTRSGNSVTNFLTSLAELETPSARAIIVRYADDPRTADAPEGPGAPMSQTVELLLQMHFSG